MVIERVARNPLEDLWRSRVARFVGLKDFLLCAGERALKAPHNGHRDDDVLVLVALVCASQTVGYRPDEIHFIGDVDRFFVSLEGRDELCHFFGYS